MSATEADNIVAASARSKYDSRLSLVIFDNLPRRLRDALNVAAFDWCPEVIRQIYAARLRRCRRADQAQRFVLGVIANNDTSEIEAFSARYQEQYGFPTPHVAAGVKVLR